MNQFNESVVDQILACTDFVEWFAQVGENVRELLLNSEVRVHGKWTEGATGTLQSAEIMSVNSYRETWMRPVAGSKIVSQVFLAGAHAGTGCDMWLMESATEAGKRAAIAVLENKRENAAAASIFIDKHERHPIRFVLSLGGLVTLIIGLVYHLFW
jgi:hypothetical protein